MKNNSFKLLPLPQGLCVVAMFLIVELVPAAETPPPIQWQAVFGGTGGDYLNTILATEDGGFLLGGNSGSGASGNRTSPHYGGNDFWLVKIDANGNKLWDRSFGGSNWDNLWEIVRTSDGGALLVGGSSSDVSGNKTTPSYGGNDGWLVKLDANGNTVWDRSFGGDAEDSLRCIVLTGDGGFLLGGQSGWGDFGVVKMDANGTMIWDQAYGRAGDTTLQSIVATDDAGFLLAGSRFFGPWDYWLVKVDASGNRLWDRSFGGSGDDELGSLIATGDGGFLLGGISRSGISRDKTIRSYGEGDYWVIKLDGRPKLAIERFASGVRVSWPLTAANFVLERTSALASQSATDIWSLVPFPYETNATHISITGTMPAGNNFYRLRKP